MDNKLYTYDSKGIIKRCEYLHLLGLHPSVIYLSYNTSNSSQHLIIELKDYVPAILMRDMEKYRSEIKLPGNLNVIPPLLSKKHSIDQGDGSTLLLAPPYRESWIKMKSFEQNAKSILKDIWVSCLGQMPGIEYGKGIPLEPQYDWCRSVIYKWEQSQELLQVARHQGMIYEGRGKDIP